MNEQTAVPIANPTSESQVDNQSETLSKRRPEPSDTFNAKLASYGRWTYRCAWALEIIAATIGLTTGIVLGLQAFKNSESADGTELVLASAPFFMVALAELTKIPIATLLFSAKWRWKPILAVFLFLLAGITFETVFMGLERSTTLRELRFKELQKSEGDLQRDRTRIANEISTLQSHSALSDAQDNIDKLSKLAEQDHQSIESKISRVENDLEGGGILSPQGAQLRDNLKALDEKRQALGSEQNQKVAEQSKLFTSQRDSYVERLKSADANQKAQWSQELAALKNPVPTIYADFKEKLDAIDAEIAQKRDQLDSIRASLSSGDMQQRNEAEARRKELADQLRDSDNKWATQIDKARQIIGDAQGLATSRSNAIEENNAKLFALDKQIEETESKRIVLARKDQVQRLAGWVFGQNAEDVKIESASKIGLIWFGSLAALAALAGPMCAIVALGLQKIGLAPITDGRRGGTSKLIRSYITGRRWKRVRIVTVEKEVPVERLIKEILYIPLLTDDPDDLMKFLNSTLPDEVAEQVKLSVKGVRRGDKTQYQST